MHCTSCWVTKLGENGNGFLLHVRVVDFKFANTSVDQVREQNIAHSN